MANKEHEAKEHENKEHVKEGGHAKPAAKVFGPNQVVKIVTEVLHGLRPQPDPTVIQEVIAQVQVRVHEKEEA